MRDPERSWGDAEVEALLAAARDVAPAPADARARVAARVAATVGGWPGGEGMGGAGGGASGGAGGAVVGSGAAGGGAAGGAVAGRAVAGGLSTGGWLTVVALTAALGVGVGWVLSARSSDQVLALLDAAREHAAAGAARADLDAEPGAEPGAGRVAYPVAAPGAGPVAEPLAAPAVAVTDPAASPAALPGVDHALAAERALLQVAREALVHGRADAALAAVRAHHDRFARGRLGEEREVIWIRALLARGEVEPARDRARRFVAAHPDSLFRPAIEALVAR